MSEEIGIKPLNQNVLHHNLHLHLAFGDQAVCRATGADVPSQTTKPKPDAQTMSEDPHVQLGSYARAICYVVLGLWLFTRTASGQPQWEQISLADTSVVMVAPHPFSPSVIFCAIVIPPGGLANHALLKSTDSGEHWTTVIPAGAGFAPVHISFSPATADTMLASGLGTFFWSTDEGTTWAERQTNLPFPGYVVVIPAYSYATQGEVFVVAQGAGLPWPIYRSTNGGADFEPLDVQPTWGAFKFLTFRSHPEVLAVLPYGPYSCDAGATWGALDPDTIVSEIWDISASSGAAVFATRVQLEGENSHVPFIVSRSSDSAAWVPTLQVQLSDEVIAVHPLNPDMIVVTDSNHIAIRTSLDGGITWGTDSDSIISSLWIKDLEFSSDGEFLFLASMASAGDSQSGLWRRLNPEAADDGAPIPRSFALQVYPNPFNSVAQVLFHVSRRANVQLAVYDVLGREIDVLYQGSLEQGNYSRAWSPAAVSSGVFFAVFRSDQESAAAKMILLK